MKSPTVAAVAVAVAGGLSWAVCFGSRPALALPWLALVPLVLLLGTRRPLLAGWLHGLVFWLASIYWIVPTLETYGGLQRWLAVPALVLLCSYLGAYHAVFAAVGARLWRHSAAASMIGLPALWVLLEVVETRLLTGFPWNLAAYSVVEVPAALRLAGWVGAYGVSALVVLANVVVALLASGRRIMAVQAGLATVFLALGLGLVGGTVERMELESRSSYAVRLVQPNTPIVSVSDDERTVDGYRRLLELSRRACEPGVLVVWPESAAWPLIYERDERLRRDLAGLAVMGCPVLFNSVSRRDDRYFNSALLLDAGGSVQGYDKMHLVPFGEYVPLGGRWPLVQRLARAAGDFSPGEERKVLRWRELELGTAICFEIIFPGEVASRAREGADVLVTITNDAWYGDTAAPWQHLRAARFRAAETRLPVVRAALTGVSAVIAPDGSVESWLALGEQGVLEARVQAAREPSLYAQAPWLVPVLCLALFGSAIFRSCRRSEPGRQTRGRTR